MAYHSGASQLDAALDNFSSHLKFSGMSDAQQKRAVSLTQKFLEKVSLNDNVSLLVAALTLNEKAALLKD